MAPALKSKKLFSKEGGSNRKEDIDWVIEGVVGYLQSPTWNVPVQNFFDDNCSIFENKEENKFEYTDIHMKYKELVEELLSQYIQELGISEDLFSRACKQDKSAINNVEIMFEFIWAADDFLLFKRLMTKHNVDLEMQTLNFLQSINGADQGSGDNYPYNPKYMQFYKKEEPSTSAYKPEITVFSNDEDIMKEILDESQEKFSEFIQKQRELEEREASDLKKAIEYSKREMDRLNAQAEEEKRMLEEAIRLSLQFANLATSETSSEETLNKTKEIVESTVTNVPKIVEPTVPVEIVKPTVPVATSEIQTKEVRKSAKVKKKSNTQVNSLPPLRKKSNADAALDWLSSAQNDQTLEASESLALSEKNQISPPSPIFTKVGIDPAELTKRKQYLQEQREKMIALKKKQRAEELERYQSESPELKKGDKKDENSSASDEKAKMLKARLALAERLKREVIQKKT